MVDSFKHPYSYSRYMVGNTFEIYHYDSYQNDIIPLHEHDFHEIYLFLHGNVTYIVNDIRYCLSPNDVVVLPAGVAHRPIFENPDQKYERVVLWINKDYLKSICDGLDLSICFNYPSNFYIPYDLKNAFTIRFILQQLLIASETEGFGKETLCISLIMQLLIYLQRIFTSEPSIDIEKIKKHPVINRVIEYINSHISEKLTLEQIAKNMFINKYHLSHIFKDYMGLSVYQYIIWRRMSIASQMIYNGHSIVSVAIACGYNTYSNFFKAFKKHFNVTPKEYYSIMHTENDPPESYRT